VGKELLISGHSSDNIAKNCSVSVIVNNVRPYQNAIAKGSGGINDFSQWEFSLRNDYSQLIEERSNLYAKRRREHKAIISDIPKNANADLENLDPN
jgi:hypothetical protein